VGTSQQKKSSTLQAVGTVGTVAGGPSAESSEGPCVGGVGGVGGLDSLGSSYKGQRCPTGSRGTSVVGLPHRRWLTSLTRSVSLSLASVPVPTDNTTNIGIDIIGAEITYLQKFHLFMYNIKKLANINFTCNIFPNTQNINFTCNISHK